MATNRQSAFDCAANYLSYQDRTEKQLHDKLKQKEYTEQEIEEAIEKLKSYGYINDERFTDLYRQAQASRKGDRRIKQELMQKGVSNNVIDQVFSSNEHDETSAVLHILEQRYSDADFEDEKQQRRIYGFFLRRGFGYDDIKKAIRIYAKNDKF